MDSAIVTVDYKLDGVNYSRRVFASYPDQAGAGGVYVVNSTLTH